MWIEEAYEISSEDDFNMLDESIRGAVPDGSGLFKQITLTLNPWNEHHWIKKRFFDNTDDETLAMTTNYKCNEWLDKDFTDRTGNGYTAGCSSSGYEHHATAVICNSAADSAD